MIDRLVKISNIERDKKYCFILKLYTNYAASNELLINMDCKQRNDKIAIDCIERTKNVDKSKVLWETHILITIF